jgi:hypothetical protein
MAHLKEKGKDEGTCLVGLVLHVCSFCLRVSPGSGDVNVSHCYRQMKLEI